MKIKLIAKLQKLERTMSWFWKHYVDKQTGLSYPAFMNQLSIRGKIRADIGRIINDFLGEVK